jgi:hypothetical protein
MHEDAMPKGALWRLIRTAVIAFALMLALTLVGKALSFSDSAYGVGALIIFILATLTDRTDFYNAGPR